MGDDIGQKFYEVYALVMGDPTALSWDTLDSDLRNTWNAAAMAIKSGGGEAPVIDLDAYITEWRKGMESSKSYDGAVDPYFDQIEADWRKFLISEKPLFRAEYDAMTDAERAKLGTTIWAGNFQSGGRANTVLSEIYDKYIDLAKADREELRKNYVVRTGKFKGKKWSGSSHKIAPNGTRYAIIGHRYGWYTRPDHPAAITENWLTRFRR